MTDIIIQWSGLILPLLGFIWFVAWKFPETYNQLMAPILMTALAAAFIAMAGWNWGMESAEGSAFATGGSAVEKIDHYSRPNALFIEHGDRQRKESLAEYEEKAREWDEKYYRALGAETASKAITIAIDQNQFNYWDYYWFVALFCYLSVLSNIRKWFETLEGKLRQKKYGSPSGGNDP